MSYTQVFDSLSIRKLFEADSLWNANLLIESEFLYEELLSRDFVPVSILLEQLYTINQKTHNSTKAHDYAIRAINNGRHYWYQGQIEYDVELIGILRENNDILRENQLFEQYRSYLNSDSLCLWVDIRKSLLERKTKDQFYRKRGDKKTDDEWAEQKLWDNENQIYLDSILCISEVWPGFKQVGKDGESSAYLIAQHSEDSTFQLKCLKLMKDQLHQDNIYPSHYALLLDRHCIQNYGYQLFGTQVYFKDCIAYPKLLWNEKYVHVLRLYFGLPPLDYYLASMKCASD